MASQDEYSLMFGASSLSARRGLPQPQLPTNTLRNNSIASSHRPSLTPSTAASIFSHGDGMSPGAYSEASSGAPPESYLNVPAAAKSGSRRSSAPTESSTPWCHDHDQRLRAAVANVNYERGNAGLDSSSSTSGKSWSRIAAVAFPQGEHNKEECAARFRLLNRPSVVKGAWSKAEDDRLLRLVEEHGAERWVIIAQHMGSRSGKQCRERWHNHVDPTILRRPFSPEEDAIIIALYNSIGSKWAEMSKRLKGRPDNSIKNHFNTTLSRRRMLAAAVQKASNVGADSSTDSMDQSQSRNNSMAYTSTDDGDDSFNDSGYYSAGSKPLELYPSQNYAQVNAGFDARRIAAMPQRHSMSSEMIPANFLYDETREQHAPRFTSSLAFAGQQPLQQQRQQPIAMQRNASASAAYSMQPNFSFIGADASPPRAPQPHVSPLDYEHAQHNEYRDNTFAYSVPQYENQFAYMQPRADGTWMPTPQQMQQSDIAPAAIERNVTNVATPRRSNSNGTETAHGERTSSGSSLRQQAESLSSWQSVNGHRALPPLSLVAGTVRDSPQTPNRPRAQSIIARLTSSACGSNTKDASDAGGANSALAMADVDEGQKAALPPPFRLQGSSIGSSTSIQRLTLSGRRDSSKRSASDLDDDAFEERPRQRARDSPASSPLENRSFRPMVLSPSSRHNQERSDSVVSATPTFGTGQASYLSHGDGLSVPGSAITAASSLLPSPMDVESEADAHDYFNGTKGTANYGAVAAYQFTNASPTAAYAQPGQGKNAIGIFGMGDNNDALQSHLSH